MTLILNNKIPSWNEFYAGRHWTSVLTDTQRYKTLGNAVTVNVIEWIAKRIMEVGRN